MARGRGSIEGGRAIAVACSLGAALSFAPRASMAVAQDDDYHTVVEEAVSEFDRGNHAESLALFLRAHGLRPSARTLRGLGMVSFELRRYVDCIRYLDDALTSSVQPLTEEQRAEATALLARARGFVGRFSVTSDPAGAPITVDGNESAAELTLDVGEHTISASAEGYASASRRVTVSGGEDTSFVLVLEPLEGPVVERVVERVVPPPPDLGEPYRIAGWTLGIVGAVGFVLGMVGVAERERTLGVHRALVEAGSCPPMGPGAVPDCERTLADAVLNERLALGLGIPGGALLASGVGLLIAGYVMAPGGAPTSARAARGPGEVFRGIEPPLTSRPGISIRWAPFADLGVACHGAF